MFISFNRTKPFKMMFVLLIAISLTLSFFACAPKDDLVEEEAEIAKNIILLIGDGMGFEQINATRIYNDNEPLIMETLPYQGAVTTNAYIKELPTDSAAAGTALATGNKVIHFSVAMLGERALKSITEYSMDAGKKTGIISTKDITDATPAAFSSHAPNRSNEDIIIEGQINSNIDLFMGQGKSIYDPHAERLISKGYSYLNTKAELESCDSQKIFAMFDSVTPDSEHSLAFLAQKALDTFSQNNDNGFFLMVEGSKIDSKCHSNDMDGMLAEINAFDEAVNTALNFASADENTLIIVVADHETGDLVLPASTTKEDLDDELFHSSAHTSKKVPYFAYGPTAKDFLPEIENTDIFVYMMSAFGLEITEPCQTEYYVFPSAA